MVNLLSKWLESLDYDYQILPHCSRLQSPRSSCDECISSCPEQAIRLKDGKPVIHSGQCIECGDCVASCPVQAVEGFLPHRTIIDSQFIIDRKNVPTLKELLIYYKKGVTTIVCEEDAINPEWQEILKQANKVLRELGEAPFAISYDKKTTTPAENSISRRELFFSLERDVKQIAKKMTPAKWRFNHESLDLPKYYPEHQFVDISLDTSKCTLCQACQSLCTKDCLQINETTFSIIAQQCSNCSLCQDICPEQAISVKQMISHASVIHHPIFNKKCSTCAETFETLNDEQLICMGCKKKKEYAMM